MSIMWGSRWRCARLRYRFCSLIWCKIPSSSAGFGDFFALLCSLSVLIDRIIKEIYWAQMDLETIAYNVGPICQALDEWLTLLPSSKNVYPSCIWSLPLIVSTATWFAALDSSVCPLQIKLIAELCIICRNYTYCNPSGIFPASPKLLNRSSQSVENRWWIWFLNSVITTIRFLL